jgi:mono/diheme cytochrome c family protein
MSLRQIQSEAMRWAMRPTAFGVTAAAILLSGCKPLPPSKPATQFTPVEARGGQVFQANCARCHYPTTTRGLKGPGLQALTKVKSMPSGAPPTDERLTDTVLHGHGMMQPVPLSNADLQYLLAYLHTL